jgi:hypothetical protein
MAIQTPNGLWTGVFTSAVPGHAKLVASMLEVVGVDVTLTDENTDGSLASTPYVLVREHHAEQARQLLAAYGLVPSGA